MMFRIVAILLALTISASAQVGIGTQPNFSQLRPAPSGGGFSGPGDVVASATAFYSCARAYNAAYAVAAGTLCVIADVGTGAITCTMKAATTGFADLTSNLCAGGTLTVPAFCTAHTSCVVSAMTDQTAGAHCTAPTTSCDIAQATLANMPALTFSALNGLPCTTLITTSFLSTATPLNTIAAQPFSQTFVGKQTTGGSNLTLFGALNPGTYWPSSSTIGMFAGTAIVSAAATLNTFIGASFVYNGASSAIQVGASLTSALNPGTNGLGTGGNHIGLGNSSAGMIGLFCEGGIWPIALSSGQQSSLYTNMNSSSGYNGGL